MAAEAVIEVTNLSVLFPLYHGSSRSLKKMVVAAASGRLAKDQQQRVVVRALSDINLRLVQWRPAGTGRLERGGKDHAAAGIGWDL